MSQQKSPPPGSMPSSLGSPDVQSMMNQMMAAKSGNGGQPASSGGNPTSSGQPAGTNPAAAAQRDPRAIGTPLQEIKYVGQDVGAGILEIIQGFFPQLRILPTDTPETQAKKKQMTQRMQNWDKERIQFAHQKYQEEMQKKKQDEEMEKQKTAQKAAAKQDLPTPAGKKSGAAAPGAGQSKKQSFTDDFNKKRQQLSSAG
jgi:hypothetical protein